MGTFTLLTVGLGLSLPSHSPTPAPVNSVKHLDQYWAETGLEPQSFSDMIDGDSCHSSRRYFLACVNAVQSVANRLGFEFSQSGDILKNQFSGPVELTELRQLGPWSEAYSQDPNRFRKIPFLKVWTRLIESDLAADQKAALTGTAYNAFLSVFRDPHSYILPLEYYQNVVANSHAASALLGVVIARGEKGYFLRKVIEGSSAARSGLRRGDWLVSVNGTELKSLTPQRMSDLLKATEGQTTVLQINRKGRLLRLKIQRSSEPIPSVVWKPLESDERVGVLTLHKFAQGSCKDMKMALKEMKDKSLKGILLDLRDNTGGHMDEAACMVSLFVGPDRPAFRIRYLDPARDSETHFGTEPVAWKGRLAILINSGSASASEILAGSLRDHGRAILVGERSFGKGSFQEGELWGRNAKVAFFQTKGFYYLPSGYSPQLKGIAPDVVVGFRQSEALREEDQYLNPLSSPTDVTEPLARRLDLSKCRQNSGILDDPQLSQAQSALFCDPIVAGGPRAAL